METNKTKFHAVIILKKKKKKKKATLRQRERTKEASRGVNYFSRFRVDA